MTVKMKALVAGLALAALSAGPGLAFREAPVAGSTAGERPPVATLESEAAPSITFDASEDAEADTKGGTEIRVPGLGRLGTLPRLDFGLELLYSEPGATDAALANQGADVGSDVRESERGLQVRGSITHHF